MTGGLEPVPPSGAASERNREIVAERLGWPGGALEACRKIEAGAPGWYCWWTSTPYPDPGFQPAYGAALIRHSPLGNPPIYARTPAELAELIGPAARAAGGRDA